MGGINGRSVALGLYQEISYFFIFVSFLGLAFLLLRLIGVRKLKVDSGCVSGSITRVRFPADKWKNEGLISGGGWWRELEDCRGGSILVV